MRLLQTTDVANVNLMNAVKILPTELLVVSSFFNLTIKFYSLVIFNQFFLYQYSASRSIVAVVTSLQILERQVQKFLFLVWTLIFKIYSRNSFMISPSNEKTFPIFHWTWLNSYSFDFFEKVFYKQCIMLYNVCILKYLNFKFNARHGTACQKYVISHFASILIKLLLLHPIIPN